MIRVLHVIDSLDLGGAQTALLNLVRFADRQRFHHEVAAMHGEGIFAAAFRAENVPVHSLSSRRLPPAYLWNLPALLRRGNFDVVQFHLFGANWIAKPVAALSGIRTLYHHDQCNDAFRSSSWWATLLDTWTNSLSTRILAVSHSIENFTIAIEGIPADRVIYFPNGVDTSEFHPTCPAERLAARRALNLPTDTFLIGGVGRFVPQKNFPLLVESVATISRERPAVHLALFGGGPGEPELREIARATSCPVTFAGTVTNRPQAYAALDLLVLPSLYEGLPLTVLEAMAAGIPVVASAVDGINELTSIAPNALETFPSQNAAALNSVIHRLLADPTRRDQLATAGRELVCKYFDARHLAAKLESLYEADLAIPAQ